MTVHADERKVERPAFLPDEMSDAQVHDLEFTVAISSEERETTADAPMLEALTTVREQQLN